MDIDYTNPDSVAEGIKAVIAERGLAGEEYVRYYIGRVGDMSLQEVAIQNGFLPVYTPLTPDIIMVDRNSQTINLGDVTVTRNVSRATASKLTRYEDLRAELASANPNWNVRALNVIIDESGSNLPIIEEQLFQLSGIAKSIKAYNRLLTALNVARRKLETIFARDRTSGKGIAKAYEQETPEEYSIKIENLIDDMPDVVPSQPINQTMEEFCDEVAELVKKTELPYRLTEEIHVDDLFEQNLFTLNSMRQIVDIDKVKTGMQFIMSNSHYEDKNNVNLLADYIHDLNAWSQINGAPLDTTIVSSLPKMNAVMTRLKIPGNDKEKFMYGHSEMDEGAKIMLASAKQRNEHKEPETVNKALHNALRGRVQDTLDELAQESSKTNGVMWDNKISGLGRVTEEQCEAEIRKYSDTLRATGAYTTLNTLSLFSKFIMQNKKMMKKYTTFIPENGSCIIITLPDAAMQYSSSCNIPYYCITRTRLGVTKCINDHAVKHRCRGLHYNYYMTKVHRAHVSKISFFSEINASTLCSCAALAYMRKDIEYGKRLMAFISMLTIDLHQRPSDYTDLMKYLCTIGMSEYSNLDKLILDKMAGPLKTDVDVYLYYWLRDYINMTVEAKKHNDLVKTSFKATRSEWFKVGSMFSTRQDVPITLHIEEAQLIATCVQKKKYGSQFMDKSMANLAIRNNEYEREIEIYKGWVTDGIGDGEYPLESKYAFNTNAIILGQQLNNQMNAHLLPKIMNGISYSTLTHFLPDICDLKGSCKLREYRDQSGNFDIHTTSLEAAIQLANLDLPDNEYRIIRVAQRMIREERLQEYSMSEKEQRGPGRPIGSPDIMTKCGLRVVEETFKMLQRDDINNVIRSNVDKASSIHGMYDRVVTEGNERGHTKLMMFTEDQAKWSEEDNMRKYYPLVDNCLFIPKKLKVLIKRIMDGSNSRIQYSRRVPVSVLKDPLLSRHVVDGGIKTNIGWVQGMYNNTSTQAHNAAVLLINAVYSRLWDRYQTKHSVGSDKQPYIEDLIHSDDSCSMISYNEDWELELFIKVRHIVKRMMCLKVNIKKSSISRHVMEMVSNYCVNGDIISPISKIIVSSFSDMSHISPTMDSQSLIGKLQTLARNGATLPILVMVRSMMKEIWYKTYNFHRGHSNDFSKYTLRQEKLPLECGGWPDCTTFELCVSGVAAHNLTVATFYKTQQCKEEKCVRGAILRSLALQKAGEMNDVGEHNLVMDASDIIKIRDATSLFSSVKYVVPLKKKVVRTAQAVKSLPDTMSIFSGLLNITSNKMERLGDLKKQFSSGLVQLAMSGYHDDVIRKYRQLAQLAGGKMVIGLDGSYSTLAKLISDLEVPDDYGGVRSEDFLMPKGQVPSLTRNVASMQVSYLEPRGGTITNRQGGRGKGFTLINSIPSILANMIDMEKANLEGYTLNDPSAFNVDVMTIKSKYSEYFKQLPLLEAAIMVSRITQKEATSKVWKLPYLNVANDLMFLITLYGNLYSSHDKAVFKGNVQNTVSSKSVALLNRYKGIYSTIGFLRTNGEKPSKIIIDGLTVSEWMKFNNPIDALDNDEPTRYKAIVGAVEAEITGRPDIINKLIKDETIISRFVTRGKYSRMTGYTGPFSAVVTGTQGSIMLSGHGSIIDSIVVDQKISKRDTDYILTLMKYFVTQTFDSSNYATIDSWGFTQYFKNNFPHAEQHLVFFPDGMRTQVLNRIEKVMALDKGMMIKYTTGRVIDNEWINIQANSYYMDQNKIRHIDNDKEILSVPVHPKTADYNGIQVLDNSLYPLNINKMLISGRARDFFIGHHQHITDSVVLSCIERNWKVTYLQKVASLAMRYLGLCSAMDDAVNDSLTSGINVMKIQIDNGIQEINMIKENDTMDDYAIDEETHTVQIQNIENMITRLLKSGITGKRDDIAYLFTLNDTIYEMLSSMKAKMSNDDDLWQEIRYTLSSENSTSFNLDVMDLLESNYNTLELICDNVGDETLNSVVECLIRVDAHNNQIWREEEEVEIRQDFRPVIMRDPMSFTVYKNYFESFGDLDTGLKALYQ
uniref:RNA-dependent RNA polymerase n=1 Tax=Hubei bunya-like virus 9 TaxID=1922854 RepID=A0A1L3KPH3_9VIRU|nr:RNA-dependent RNA polymerase [Hubei bunya-like virus 9]